MGTQQVTTFQTAFFNPADFVIPDEELKSQLQLNDEQLKRYKIKKRIRFKEPDWTKSYTFCHVNPITEELQYDGDERHIFRIRALHRIYSLIFGYCEINLFERVEKIYQNGFTVWIEDKQAEITGSEMWSIKERLKIHIKLLRYLRQGNTIKQAQSHIMKGL